METNKYLNRPFEFKSLDPEGSFQGYASIFGVVDSVGDVVVRGAFTTSLAKHRMDGTFPVMLRDHDRSKVAGVFTQIQEDEIGLLVAGKFAMDIQVGRETWAIAKMMHDNKQPFGLSIGYREVKIANSTSIPGAMDLQELDLREVSLVPFPALKVARILSVKGENGELPTLRQFEEFLRDAGFSRNQARDVCELGYKTVHDKSLGEVPEETEEACADVTAWLDETRKLLKELA